MKKYIVIMTQKDVDALWMLSGCVSGTNNTIRNTIDNIYYRFDHHVTEDIRHNHLELITGIIASKTI